MASEVELEAKQNIFISEVNQFFGIDPSVGFLTSST